MNYTLFNLLKEYKITIPLIQRDYAQGRDSAKYIRDKFLIKIKEIFTNESKLNLDFVYGCTEKGLDNSSLFIPIDGQQRLTTLWLIHLYFYKKEKIYDIDNNQEYLNILKQFTYENRRSSERFCENLVKDLSKEIKTPENLNKENIKNTPWFKYSWNNDPTIISMLNMLESIDDKLSDCDNVWEKLTKQSRFTFDYIDINSDEFKLTDELYIKMNARGKPLTNFENFKAEFSKLLLSNNTKYKNEKIKYQNSEITYNEYFGFRIENQWMDLFWSYGKENANTDELILNFIKYIAKILSNKKSLDDENPLGKVFTQKDNIKFLFDSLDFLSSTDTDKFFDNIFCSEKNDNNKVDIFEIGTTNNLFLKAIKKDKFTDLDKFLLYSLLLYSTKIETRKTDTTKIKEFTRIIRNILFNVRIQNPSNNIEYKLNLKIKELPKYNIFIEKFINLIKDNPEKDINNLLSENDFSDFNLEIIEKEKKKAKLIIKKPEIKEHIIRLENHHEIKGNISCFKLDCDNAIEKINAFEEIWSEEKNSSLITRAFLTVGDFEIATHNNDNIWYFGLYKYWNIILTNSFNAKTTKEVSDNLDKFLIGYIKSTGSTPKDRLNNMVTKWLGENEKKYGWGFYFIKYCDTTSYKGRYNSFYWNTNEGYDIDNVGNTGSNPLASYHINPYIYTLYNKINDDSKAKKYYGRYSTERSFLYVKGEIKIYMKNEGWKIKMDNSLSLPEKLITDFGLKKEGEGDRKGYVLCEKANKDRIETAIEFIEEYCKLVSK